VLYDRKNQSSTIGILQTGQSIASSRLRSGAMRYVNGEITLEEYIHAAVDLI